MDWPKAKNILIIILLVLDMILLAMFCYSKIQSDTAIKNSIENAIAFAKANGVEVETQLPKERPSLEALRVVLKDKSEGQSEYNGYALRSSLEKSFGMNVVEARGVKIKVGSASSALTQFVSEHVEAGGSRTTVESIELVYYVMLGDDAQIDSENTAAPHWLITAGGEEYFLRAY